jgi:hypothetical protein
MQSHRKTAWWICLALVVVLAHGESSSAAPAKVRLFILSAQSNMVGVDPDESFTPALKKAFPRDELIVVKQAAGGLPIRSWYKAWKAPQGVELPKASQGKPGNSYDRLTPRIQKAIEGRKIDTVAFVWMQGERDAKEGFPPFTPNPFVGSSSSCATISNGRKWSSSSGG